ncbi:GGDEF domain-containing protein [Cytobacillus gottheilii]|uniref:GGDEF domain-containing protein n=1 Tax=Cytobacillus gottheilii TaxID=859144 RepID=UPI0009BC2B6C|nr:GGDEF domain-containing protein [Cytobacillus gottheilii]
MMDQNVIHTRNIFAFLFIILFYFIQAGINMYIEGVQSIFPPAFLFIVFASILAFFIWKNLLVKPVITMYVIIFLAYGYFIFLLEDSPYLVNFFFMWLCIPLSAIYQRMDAVLTAGSLSLIVTFYSVIRFRDTIFAGVDLIDFPYFFLFGVILTACLAAFILSNRKLLGQVKEKEEQLTYLLHQTKVSTWSCNANNGVILATSRETGAVNTYDLFNEDLFKRVYEKDRFFVQKKLDDLKNNSLEDFDFRIVDEFNELTWLQCRVNHSSKNGVWDGILINITKEKTLEDQMRKLAYYDPLTGAANRYLLKQFFDRNRTDLSGGLALLFLDMDGFKQINDTYGHEAGDQLLKHITKKIQAQLKITDLLCRLGGDEFVILMTEIEEKEALERKNIIQMVLNDRGGFSADIHASASIGFAYENSIKNADLNTLLNKADAEMYSYKGAAIR